MPLRSRAYSDFRPGWIIIPAGHDGNKAHRPSGVTQQLYMCATIANVTSAMKGGFVLMLLLLGRSKKKFPTVPKH